MRTQTVITRPGPKSRVEKMHDHANWLRTGPCSRGRHDYQSTRTGFFCARCDEPMPHPMCLSRVVIAVDPAAPDEPPIIATADGFVNLADAPCGHAPVWWVDGVCMVCGPRKPRPQITESMRRAMAEGRLLLDGSDYYVFARPLRNTLRRERPHIDIHPNGGIPG